MATLIPRSKRRDEDRHQPLPEPKQQELSTVLEAIVQIAKPIIVILFTSYIAAQPQVPKPDGKEPSTSSG